MYIWNIEKLKDDIKKNNLTEKDRFYYMFINFIISSLLMNDYYTYFSTVNPTTWEIVSNTLNSIIEALGVFSAFIVNGANKGKDFLGKYFSISFVVFIRFLVLLIPISFIHGVFDLIITGGSEDIQNEILDSDTYSNISVIIWSIFMYIRICKHIKDLKDF